MEYLSGWARGVIALAVASSFIELLIPKGDIKKYVRFASGLILILMMIKPLLDIRKTEIILPEPLAAASYEETNVHDVYVEKLERNVEQALDIENVEITVNPKMLTEILYVKSKVKRAEIAKYLNLPPERVGD